VSDLAKDLLHHLLDVNIKTRFSVTEALNHGWFELCKKFVEENDYEKDVLDEECLENLRNFKKTSKLRSVALNILVKMLPTSEIETLKS